MVIGHDHEDITKQLGELGVHVSESMPLVPAVQNKEDRVKNLIDQMSSKDKDNQQKMVWRFLLPFHF